MSLPFFARWAPRSSSTPSFTTNVPITPSPSLPGWLFGGDGKSDRPFDSFSLNTRPSPCPLMTRGEDVEQPDKVREGGKARGAEWPRARSEPRLSLIDSAVCGGRFSTEPAETAEPAGPADEGIVFRIETGGGEGDDSTHSSSSSPVCQAGKAAAAMMRLVGGVCQSQRLLVLKDHSRR